MMRPLRFKPTLVGPLFILVLAFQIQHLKPAQAIQAASAQSSGEPIQINGEQQHAAGVAVGPTGSGVGPMLSMGSESSSPLESSAALAGDDLMAAESSQSSAESAAAAQQQAAAAAAAASEHKAFTNAQVVRQQEMPASVAPAVFANQQQQPHFNMQQQQQQQPPQIQARIQHPQQRPFNPFMAAALAGNYGHAQQHIAANAAAAGMHASGPPAHHHPYGPAQQQHQHHAHQPQQQHHPHPGQQHMMAGPPHQHLAHHQQQHPSGHQLINHSPQVHARPPMGPPQQQQQVAVAPPQQQAQGEPVGSSMAVQESSVRNNIMAPPGNFVAANSQLDSNSIELADAPQAQPQTSSQQQQPTQMAVASSVQHPVIASSSVHDTSSSSSSSSVVGPSGAGAWPLQAPDIPKIVNLEVKCEKNLMKVSIEFDKVFNGVIFSKGHYNQGQCLHVGSNSGKQQAYFDIGINSCGTQGNTQNGLYGMGGNTGSGTFFENTIVIQYDPNVQEVYDHARKLRCTWHDQYEKAVTFRPFPVDMLDIVRADFAGDNVGCWMQIQVGKGPWASEVAGIVKIGQTMTMVLAIKDEENKFDMLVRNCFAHDGKRGPIELVDKSGCITRPKLMSKFTKIKNFGSSATVLSYAHFQAFKFPDSMEVHFQCTIQICRHQCPEQCSAGPNGINALPGGESFSESTISGTLSINGRDQTGAGSPSSDSVHLRKYGSAALSRDRRDLSSRHHHQHGWRNGSHLLNNNNNKPLTQTVGVNRVIQVVSTGDLAFSLQQQQQQQQPSADQIVGEHSATAAAAQLTRVELQGQVCMSSYNFVLSLVVLSLVLLCSCLAAITLYLRHRSLMRASCPSSKLLVPQQQQQHHHHHHSPTTNTMTSIRSSNQQHQVPTSRTATNHRHPNDHFQSQMFGN